MKDDTRMSRLADELARQADISSEQARRVLEALKVADLLENMDTLRNAMTDPQLAKALGRDRQAANQAAKALDPAQLSLRHVGLVFKRADMLGLEVAV